MLFNIGLVIAIMELNINSFNYQNIRKINIFYAGTIFYGSVWDIVLSFTKNIDSFYEHTLIQISGMVMSYILVTAL
jgi:hypothetical protein